MVGLVALLVTQSRHQMPNAMVAVHAAYIVKVILAFAVDHSAQGKSTD